MTLWFFFTSVMTANLSRIGTVNPENTSLFGNYLVDVRVKRLSVLNKIFGERLVTWQNTGRGTHLRLAFVLNGFMWGHRWQGNFPRPWDKMTY
jgi:hypothetical protein